MTHHYYDNVRPLICPQVRRHGHYTGVAKVVRLYPTLRWPRHWRAVMFGVLGVVAVTALAAALAFAWRSATATMGQLVPGPWW